MLWEREVAMFWLNDDAGFVIGQRLLLIVGRDAMRDSASMSSLQSWIQMIGW